MPEHDTLLQHVLIGAEPRDVSDEPPQQLSVVRREADAVIELADEVVWHDRPTPVVRQEETVWLALSPALIQDKFRTLARPGQTPPFETAQPRGSLALDQGARFRPRLARLQPEWGKRSRPRNPAAGCRPGQAGNEGRSRTGSCHHCPRSRRSSGGRCGTTGREEVDERLEGERLVDEGHAGLARAEADARVGMAGDQDDRNTGIEVAQAPTDFEPVHPRHHVVEEHAERTGARKDR